MNTITLLGRVATVPELKSTASGTSVCSFRLAVRRSGTNSTTDFFTIVAWRQTAEFAAHHLRRGERIALSGTLITRPVTAADGVSRTVCEIVANQIEFADSARTPIPDTAAPSAREEIEAIVDDGDAPF